MGNFTGGNRSGGWRSDRGGDRGGRGGFGGGRPQMHSATCVECGQECEVPFKPNGLKPIFCSDCFKNNGGPDRSNDRPRFDKPAYDQPKSAPAKDQYKEQFDMLNVKLDYILKALSALGATKVEKKEEPKVFEEKKLIATPKLIETPKFVEAPKSKKESKPAKKEKKAKKAKKAKA